MIFKDGEIKRIIFRKNLQKHIKFLLLNKKDKEERKTLNSLFLNNKRSKYLDTLHNKMANSEILLMKSKFDYLLDKLKYKNMFRRDYSLLDHKSNNNIINISRNKNNKELKNMSLPNIFNNYESKQEECKKKIFILKKPKLLQSKINIINNKNDINKKKFHNFTFQTLKKSFTNTYYNERNKFES